MKIGIDLSPIQGPHRMRGIGYTLINFINYLPDDVRTEHEFVFYVLPEGHAAFDDPLSILNLDNLRYEVRALTPQKRITRTLPGRLKFAVSAMNALMELKRVTFGDKRFVGYGDLDAFLQTDQAQSYPHSRKLMKLLVVYDIIPYVLEWDYLWSYKTARQIHGFSRKAAVRVQARRWLYLYKTKLNIRRADKLLAISDVTKRDFTRAFGVKDDKIAVTPLGVTPPVEHSTTKTVRLNRYTKTSWGYLPHEIALDPNIPFLLFVGGADRRRKLEDVVAAFNHLRAKGVPLKLVLAGDSMMGPDAIATEEIQYALKTSSYLDDIIFMGFIDDLTRDWLYKHALAFVFPSRYEGFGLPVLEAMIYECPVISYPNAATKEVAGAIPRYVNNPTELQQEIELLLKSPRVSEDMKQAGLAHVRKFSWEKTSRHIISYAGK